MKLYSATAVPGGASTRENVKGRRHLWVVLVAASLMLGLSTSSSVLAHGKPTSSLARVRAVHGTRSLGFSSHTRPHADGQTLERKGNPRRMSASVTTRSRLPKPPVTGFKTLSGMDSETEVIARPRDRLR